jgi:hypothetical protein
MNYVDFHLSGEDATNRWSALLEELQKLMWHTNVATTMRYLNYRTKRRFVESREEGWFQYVQKLCDGDQGE